MYQIIKSVYLIFLVLISNCLLSQVSIVSTPILGDAFEKGVNSSIWQQTGSFTNGGWKLFENKGRFNSNAIGVSWVSGEVEHNDVITSNDLFVDVGEYELNFYFKSSYYWLQNSDVDVRVELSEDGGNSWSLIWQEDIEALNHASSFDFPWSSGQWQHCILPLQFYVQNTVKIRFSYTGKNGAFFYLDDFYLLKKAEKSTELVSGEVVFGHQNISYFKYPLNSVDELNFKLKMRNRAVEVNDIIFTVKTIYNDELVEQRQLTPTELNFTDKYVTLKLSLPQNNYLMGEVLYQLEIEHNKDNWKVDNVLKIPFYFSENVFQRDNGVITGKVDRNNSTIDEDYFSGGLYQFTNYEQLEKLKIAIVKDDSVIGQEVYAKIFEDGSDEVFVSEVVAVEQSHINEQFITIPLYKHIKPDVLYVIGVGVGQKKENTIRFLSGTQIENDFSMLSPHIMNYLKSNASIKPPLIRLYQTTRTLNVSKKDLPRAVKVYVSENKLTISKPNGSFGRACHFFRVFDASGNTVLYQYLDKGQIVEQYNLSFLGSGLYFINVFDRLGALLREDSFVKM